MATLSVIIVGSSGKTGARVDARLRKLLGTAFDRAHPDTWSA
ncbi:hypothetical protein [Burkholderia ubonensis]|nr:hypothetical protein [Burkholderia ubonensis]VWB44079.1 hypothetical protein BUB20358_01966 [Burkholderia ubonensis]